MYIECRHIKSNGLKCESPALKGQPFCYYHSKIHTVGAEPHLKYGPLQLPAPEDSAAIQLSVARINDAIINGRIDLRKAAVLFAGLKIASHYIDPKKFFHDEKTVHSAEQTSDGDELAPTNYVCDDDEDCNECPYSELCPRCIHPGDKQSDEDDDDEE